MSKFEGPRIPSAAPQKFFGDYGVVEGVRQTASRFGSTAPAEVALPQWAELIVRHELGHRCPELLLDDQLRCASAEVVGALPPSGQVEGRPVRWT